MNNLDKRNTQIREQIFHNFVQILESFPQYKITQHLWHILRKKEDSKDPYFWTDEELLKKFEKYYDELVEDLSTEKVNED